MTRHKNTESPILYHTGENVEALRRNIENNVRYQVWNANIIRSMIEVWGTTIIPTGNPKPIIKRLSGDEEGDISEGPKELSGVEGEN